MGRFLRRLFGIQAKPRLADQRLEALRRFAVFSWQYGYTVPKSELGALKDAGFSALQAETLLASVAIARADRR